MKFAIKVAHVDDREAYWWENYDKPCPHGVHAKAKEIVDFFNSTLRPNETARVLLDFKKGHFE